MKRPMMFVIQVALAMVMMAVATNADSDLRFKVRRLEISGTRAFRPERLKRLMLTRPSSFLSSSNFYPDVLYNDLDNLVTFYHQNGYLEMKMVDTVIHYDSSSARVDLNLKIEEGKLTRVAGVTIFGNTVFSDSVLLHELKIHEGDPFRRNLVQDGMVAMVYLYAEQGYLNAVIKPDIRINSDTYLAIIDFTVIERSRANIAKINLSGNVKTRPYVIRRELDFAPGEIVRYSKLMTAQRRLYLTGLFESVFIRPQEAGDPDSTARDILVEVKESLASEFNISAGYGSVEKLRGRIELLSHNLSGRAWQVGTNINGSAIKRGAEASFSEPWTFGTRWRTDLNLLFEFLVEPGYDLSRYGGRLTIGRNLGEKANISLAFRSEDARLRHIEVTELPDDFDSRIRSFALSLIRDTRDNLFNPSRGIYTEWSNEIAGAFLKGNNTFARSIIRGKYFLTVNRATVVGSALEIGWMDYFGASDQIPLSERFYTGGPNSVRGFKYQRLGPLDSAGVPLGGKFMVVWNVAEVRRVIYKMIGAAVFIDYGSVWRRAADFRFGDMRASIGAGLRASTPIGIIRLDYGINVDHKGKEPSGRLYFSMGNTF
nr:outer membrane protein assembly factor BamA [candidate division Zixibacteria bacterium]